MNSIQEIIGEVACATGVPAPAITGKRKTRDIIRARFLAYAAARVAYPRYSLDLLALAFERLCHGTMINAFRRYSDLYERDQEFRAIARELNLPSFVA